MCCKLGDFASARGSRAWALRELSALAHEVSAAPSPVLGASKIWREAGGHTGDRVHGLARRVRARGVEIRRALAVGICGTSGIGVTAIQLAKGLRRARVVTTAAFRRKMRSVPLVRRRCCCELSHARISWRRRKSATSGKGGDVILDMVSGATTSSGTSRLRRWIGRIVQIAFQGGAKVEDRKFHPPLYAQVGSDDTWSNPDDRHWWPRSWRSRARWRRRAGRRLPGRQVTGDLQNLPAAQAAAAHALMETSQHIGKIVLTA